MNIDKNMKLSDLTGEVSPEDAKEIFASQYDQAISTMKSILFTFCGYTDEEYEALLHEAGERCAQYVPVPEGITVGEALPYVELSDLVILGMLAAEVERRAQLFSQLGGIRR